MRFAQILAEQRDHAGGKRIPRHGGGVEPGSLKGPFRRRLKLIEQRIRKALLEGRQILGHGHVDALDTRRLHERDGGIGKTCIEPRPNAWQARDHRAAPACKRLNRDKRQPLEKRGQREHVAFVIGKHQVVLRNAAAEHHRETAATGQLDDAIVLPLVAVTAHQAQLHGLRIEGEAVP